MSFIKAAILGGFVGMTASASMAADLPRRVVLPEAPVFDTTETWYLRGDVGYIHYKRPEADFSLGPVEGSMSGEGFGDSVALGLGIGYRISPMIRADVTVDHRLYTNFTGLPAGDGFAAGSVLDKGRLQSSTVMLNAYADLGTYNGFTPYVGAGIGVARNVLGRYARTSAGGALGTQLSGASDYNVAWALMAGLGYNLSDSFTLDLGYRYISLGNVRTRSYGDGAGADVGSIGAHEVRVGVRYALD